MNLDSASVEGLEAVRGRVCTNEHRWRRLEFADRTYGIMMDRYDESKMISDVRFY